MRIIHYEIKSFQVPIWNQLDEREVIFRKSDKSRSHLSHEILSTPFLPSPPPSSTGYSRHRPGSDIAQTHPDTQGGRISLSVNFYDFLLFPFALYFSPVIYFTYFLLPRSLLSLGFYFPRFLFKLFIFLDVLDYIIPIFPPFLRLCHCLSSSFQIHFFVLFLL